MFGKGFEVKLWWQCNLQVYNTNTDTLKGKQALKDRILACGAVLDSILGT